MLFRAYMHRLSNLIFLGGNNDIFWSDFLISRGRIVARFRSKSSKIELLPVTGCRNEGLRKSVPLCIIVFVEREHVCFILFYFFVLFYY